MTSTTTRTAVMRVLDHDHYDSHLLAELRDLGDEAHALLRRFATGSVEGNNRHHQARAILALGDWTDDGRGVPTLRKVLGDANGSMRIRAMAALGAAGTDEAAEALANFVRDRSRSEVELVHGARQLAKFRQPFAVDALRTLGRRRLSPETLDQVRGVLPD